MKMNRNFKRALSLILCVLMAFSTVSFAIAAPRNIEVVSDIELYDKQDGHAHVYGEWKVIKAATCTQQGVKERYCAVSGCDAYYTQSIAIVENAHVYAAWTTTTEATCSTVGTKVAVCTEPGCGHKETRSIKKLEHTLPVMYLADGTLNPEWVISVDPVHGSGYVTQVGYVRASCDICGTTETRELPVEHTLSGVVSVIRPATCSTPGAGMDKCIVCGDTVSVDIEKKEDAHVFTGLPIVTTPATCSDKGVGRNQCTECKRVFDVEIECDPDAHVDSTGKVIDWVITKTPNYHLDGIMSVNCAKHGVQSKPVYADHGLTDDDYKILAYPTCVNTGLKVAECKNCRKTIEKEIPTDDTHNWGKAEVLNLPTCKQEGKQVRRCSRHYGHVLYETTEKAEHSFSTPWTTEVEADCNSTGREANECVECAQIIKREIPIRSDAHDFVDDNGVKKEWKIEEEPTCSKVGKRSNYCYECKKNIIEEIPMHSNTLVKVSSTEANCKNEGKIFYECTLCAADIYETIPVDEDAHKYIGDPAVKIAPTCQKPGVGVTICAYCNVENEERSVAIPVDPNAHCDKDGNPVEWEVLKAPSGCEDGIEKINCYYCGTLTRTLHSNHGMSDAMFNVQIVSSCNKDGTKKSKYKCPDCNEYVYLPIRASHNGTLSKVVKEATCTTTGLALYNCGKGDHLYYEIIPAKGHVAAEEYKILKDASCTEVGQKQLYCEVCDAEIQPPETIPNAHIYTAWVIKVPGACNATGIRYRGCQNCDLYEETTYRIGHTVGEWTFAEGYDCTTGGTLYRFCTECDLLLGTKTAAPGTHGSTRTETVKATNAYCIGSKVICNVCEKVVSETKNPHKSYVVEGMEGWAPTCTTTGMTDGVLCMICGYLTKQEVIPVLNDGKGHKWEWDENGNRVCAYCGDYKVGNQDPDNNTDYDGGCKCFCHDKGIIAKILYKVCVFFWKLLDMNEKCDCGTVHWTAEE